MIVTSPRATKVAFISRCNGEHMFGVHAVTPRSLMVSCRKLYGVFQAYAVTISAAR